MFNSPSSLIHAPPCLHCGNPVPASRADGFCCAGCHAVHRLLNDAGLERYYQLKSARIAPLLGYFDRRPNLDWLAAACEKTPGRLDLDVEGIQCGACVWAIEKLAANQGGARVGVNSALGRLSLEFDPQSFDPRRYLDLLGDFGYRVRPAEAGEPDSSRGLLLRLGLCAAVAMNTMSFSAAIYFGLTEDSSGLYQLFRNLNLGLTIFSVVFGGSYFVGRAWASLRNRVAHFDIPVALGVIAAFAGSLWAQLQGHDGAIYFDSVNVFITFMLAGRFLQERTLLRSRRQLLKGEAFSAYTVTLLDSAVQEQPWNRVKAGQRLLLQPGSLCPVDLQLESGTDCEFDCAAVNGEARPQTLKAGDTVAAGSRLVSDRAVRGVALNGFSGSLLARLASATGSDEELPVLWRWTVRWNVAFVLTAAFGGAAYWLWRDPSLAPTVFISTLVVTCPCGIGIAVPLARTLAEQRLARLGLIVRQPGLLERLRRVRKVCLDKTGTLTFSHLELADPGILERLSPPQARALMGAAGSSLHPVSRSLYRELSARGVAFPEDGQAQEFPGRGVRYIDAQGEWFLGRSMASDAPARAELSLNGQPVAAFDLRERTLQDAREAMTELKALGLEVELLSGDETARVQTLAASLGLDPASAHGRLSPEDKATAVSKAPSLMVGDGLNDGPALAQALASGTPAWERGPLAGQADFSFGSASLSWLPGLFSTARDLRRVIWLNLAFAYIYNTVLLTFTLRGVFSPLWCAITMPGSSLIVTALTARSMRKQ